MTFSLEIVKYKHSCPKIIKKISKDWRKSQKNKAYCVPDLFLHGRTFQIDIAAQQHQKPNVGPYLIHNRDQSISLTSTSVSFSWEAVICVKPTEEGAECQCVRHVGGSRLPPPSVPQGFHLRWHRGVHTG